MISPSFRKKDISEIACGRSQFQRNCISRPREEAEEEIQ